MLSPDRALADDVVASMERHIQGHVAANDSSPPTPPAIGGRPTQKRQVTTSCAACGMPVLESVPVCYHCGSKSKPEAATRKQELPLIESGATALSPEAQMDALVHMSEH